MPQLKLKRSSKAILNSFAKVGEKLVGKISTEALDEIMERAVDRAFELYDEAEYAGVDPGLNMDVYVEETGALSRAIIAEGEIVEFIEYGTGVEGPNPGGKDFWFFYDEGRDIVLNDLVEQARPRMRSFYYEKDESGKYREELDEPELDEREGVFFTRGNPPNDIMAKLEEYIREITPEVLEEMQ